MLILYWFELYIKDIGVFDNNVKIFETDKLVNDPVVAFIEFDDIDKIK